jgi:hypothetical protein
LPGDNEIFVIDAWMHEWMHKTVDYDVSKYIGNVDTPRLHETYELPGQESFQGPKEFINFELANSNLLLGRVPKPGGGFNGIGRENFKRIINARARVFEESPF